MNILSHTSPIGRCAPAGFKLTKLFGIDDFSAAKDFGKVFIIIVFIIIIINVMKVQRFLQLLTEG